jgi:hypothetical protein
VRRTAGNGRCGTGYKPARARDEGKYRHVFAVSQKPFANLIHALPYRKSLLQIRFMLLPYRKSLLQIRFMPLQYRKSLLQIRFMPLQYRKSLLQI